MAIVSHIRKNGKRLLWVGGCLQERYKVKAIHTLESLPPLSHCCTALESQMTTRRVVVNADYLKVHGRRVELPRAFVALCSSLTLSADMMCASFEEF